MRSPLIPLLGFALASSIAGCAAMDAISPGGPELGEVGAPDDRAFGEGSSKGGDDMPIAPVGTKPRLEQRTSSRPRPDGPNLFIYPTARCREALESVVNDDGIPPPTRAVAAATLRCRPSERYDLRHAPCPVFAEPSNDRAVDNAIQELRVYASVCDGA